MGLGSMKHLGITAALLAGNYPMIKHVVEATKKEEDIQATIDAINRELENEKSMKGTIIIKGDEDQETLSKLQETGCELITYSDYLKGGVDGSELNDFRCKLKYQEPIRIVNPDLDSIKYEWGAMKLSERARKRMNNRNGKGKKKYGYK